MEQTRHTETVTRDGGPPLSPNLGHIVVWIVALVALGVMTGAWRSSVSGLGDQAAVADVEAFAAGVDGFRSAIADGDPFLAESHLGTLRGLAANPTTRGDGDLEDAWRYAAAVTGRAEDGDLADEAFAQAVVGELEVAVSRLAAVTDE